VGRNRAAQPDARSDFFRRRARKMAEIRGKSPQNMWNFVDFCGLAQGF
jgi:hypothetical protein